MGTDGRQASDNGKNRGYREFQITKLTYTDLTEGLGMEIIWNDYNNVVGGKSDPKKEHIGGRCPPYPLRVYSCRDASVRRLGVF